MKTLTHLCILGVLAAVLAVVPGAGSVAEAQVGWSSTTLDSEAIDVVLDEARGVLYASLPADRKVTVVDAASGAISRDIALGEVPVGMGLSPDGDHLYVALREVGSVAIIDLANDSVQLTSVEVALGSPHATQVYVVDDSRFLVSGDGSSIVLVDQTDSSQTQVASNAGPIPCGPEFTGNAGDGFVYLVESSCATNSVYKVDLAQPSSPVVAQTNQWTFHGADQVKVSVDGSRIYLPTHIASTVDLLEIEPLPTEVLGSIPVPLADGRVAYVSDSGEVVRVTNAANQVVLTRSTACSAYSGAGGGTATADSSVLYFEAGGSLCAVSLAPVPCQLNPVVSNQDDLNTAINCFNAQMPAGDHTISLGASFDLTQPLTPVTLDSPGTTLTIVGGAGDVLTGNGDFCCRALVALEGSANLYLERLLLDASGGLAVTVGSDVGAGALWVVDAGIDGSVDVEGGTFVLLRSVLRDSAVEGINATGGIVSVQRSLLLGMPSPIVSSADLVSVAYSIINGSASTTAITAVGDQASDLQVVGSVIFDAPQGIELDGPNTSTLIVNSTLWNNGTGVYSRSGDVTVTNSTVALGETGVLLFGGDVTVVSSILVNDNDCSVPVSGTHNFSRTPNCGAGFTQLTGDDFDRFGTVDDHGCLLEFETPWGCTGVLSLLEGHPAIGAGKCDSVRLRYNSTGRLEIDQRGRGRKPSNCDAGAFESPPRCNGLTVTIDMNFGASGTGTPGPDVILGTPGDDMIDAGDGDDVVCAGRGDDVVVGGAGNDTILGQGGRDVLRGNAGRDTIEGGSGDDRVLGGIDGDTLIGGGGDDFIGGFGGADTINGGDGDDRIFGGFGADEIDGGPGADRIAGLVGNDLIFGDSGNDTIDGDRGNDTINGGEGDDLLRGGNADDTLSGDDGDDTINGGKADDELSGGLGIDTCVGNAENNADTADLSCESIFGVP